MFKSYDELVEEYNQYMSDNGYDETIYTEPDDDGDYSRNNTPYYE